MSTQQNKAANRFGGQNRKRITHPNIESRRIKRSDPLIETETDSDRTIMCIDGRETQTQTTEKMCIEQTMRETIDHQQKGLCKMCMFQNRGKKKKKAKSK